MQSVRNVWLAAVLAVGLGAAARAADAGGPAAHALQAACDFEKLSEPARRAAERAVVSAGPAALAPVLGLLKSGTSGQKQVALGLLGRIGGVEQEAVLLGTWLKADEDYFVRNAARGALPDLYARFPPALLAERIANPAPVVAAQAGGTVSANEAADNAGVVTLAALYGAYKQAQAAGSLPAEVEAAAGARLRSSADAVTQAACATVLRYAKTSQAVGDLLATSQTLLSALRKNGDDAKALALVEICRAIEQIRPTGEAKQMEALSTCGVPLVEVSALGALAAMGYSGAGKALGAVAASAGGKQVGPDEDGEMTPPGALPVFTRSEAARLLAKYEGILHLDELAVAARDPAPEVRLAAVQTLGKIAAPQAAQVLRGMMGAQGDKDPQVRAAASVAFARSGQVGAITPLLQDAALRSAKGKEYRLAAIEALGELKAKEGLRVLLEGLADPDVDVVAASAQALAAAGDKRAGKELYLRWQEVLGKVGVGKDLNGVQAATAAVLEDALIKLYGATPKTVPE